MDATQEHRRAVRKAWEEKNRERMRELNRVNSQNYRRRRREELLEKSRERYRLAQEQERITQKRLKEILHYDPATGVFTYRDARGRFPAGYVAGTVSHDRTRVMTLDGVKYSSGRLAFLYMTGKWPKFRAVHKDGDPLNNAWTNMEDAQPKHPEDDGPRSAPNNPLLSVWR